MIEAGLVDFQLGEYVEFIEFLIVLFCVSAAVVFTVAKVRSSK